MQVVRDTTESDRERGGGREAGRQLALGIAG